MHMIKIQTRKILAQVLRVYISSYKSHLM